MQDVAYEPMALPETSGLTCDASRFMNRGEAQPTPKPMNTDPMRTRRLLLHKREIMKLMGQVQQKGFTLIPLSVYLKNGRMKLEIGLARGKKLFDKRADLKEKAVKRDNDRKYQIK